MQTANISRTHDPLFPNLPDADARASFWEAQFLPKWIPLLLSVALSICSGILITNGDLFFLVPIALVIPVSILLLKYPFGAVLIWLLVFPFFTTTPSATDRYMYWLLHRAMIPLALGIIILSHCAGLRKREAVRFGRAELAMLFFLILALTNILLLNPRPATAIIHLYDRVFIPFCMYWLVRRIAQAEKDLKRLVGVAFITVLVQASIGMLSWFVPHLVPSQWLGRVGERMGGTFNNPAVYTSTLIFLSLLLLQYAMQSKARRVRAVLLLMFGLSLFCVFFSFSRGSWLGGAFVLIGLLFVYPRMVLRLSIISSMLVIIISSTLLSKEIAFAFERLNDQRTAEGRIVQNATAFRLIKERPWFGWGFGMYDLYDEQYSGRVADVVAQRRDQTSHNTFLLIMVEMGVPSLLLYMFPVVWWLILTKKVMHRLPQHGLLSWHLVVLLWLLILDHFTVNNFMAMFDASPFGTTIWWLALALIASLVYPYVKPRDTGAPTWVLLARDEFAP